MSENLVIKRDGRAVSFDEKKIYRAIKRAAGAAMKPSDIQYVVDEVLDYFKNDDSVTVDDNANINTDAPMGIMLKLGTEGAKSYVYNYFLDEKVSKACKDGILHYHDADFSLITFNCLQLRIKKVFKNGFSTGHGFLREPNSIRSAAALAAIAIQSSQNDMFKPNRLN